MNLKEILGKKAEDLSAEEKAFLLEHKEFLNQESLDKFKSVFADSNSNNIENLIKGIGDIVEAKVKTAVEKAGFNKPNVDVLPQKDNAKTGRKQAYEHVQKLWKEHEGDMHYKADQMAFDACATEKEKEEYLGKARSAYFFKNYVMFAISKDPEYLQHVKALAEGVDADGGYLVPTEFRAELIRDLKDKPFLRNLVRVIPMSTDSMEMPSLGSSVKTSWGSENTAISTTTASFGTLTLTPYRLNSLLYTSRELVADSAISIIPLITELFNEAIGLEEDRVIINGSGSSQPKGILQETLGGIDNANVDANLAANLKKLPLRLGTAYRAGSRWLMNSRSLEAVASLTDNNGQFLFKEGIEGISPHRLAGYPVEEQNDMPLDTILFGNLKYYFLGDRQKLSVETTTEGAGTFEKHQVAIKVVERIDGKVAVTNAFKTLTNAGID